MHHTITHMLMSVHCNVQLTVQLYMWQCVRGGSGAYAISNREHTLPSCVKYYNGRGSGDAGQSIVCYTQI